jgi:prophage tail gpP-like protein
MSDARITDPFVLRVDGLEWKFWKNSEISVQLDAIAGTFNISAADPWKEGARMLPLAAGMECEVLIGPEYRVLTGYIDKVSPSLSATDHGIAVSGRSKSADLVDCSAVHKPGQWINQDALQLATILAAPFGVSVRSRADVGAPIASFKLEQGETAFEALDRVLKQRELLGMSFGDGGILLAKVGDKSSPAPLEQGKNVLSASADFDLTDRFSDYLLQAQQPGNDKEWGKAAAEVHAERKDPAIKRYRPLIVRAESRQDSAGAAQRAAWECTVRAARSVSVTVTVQGFRAAPGGELWEENRLTDVKIPYLDIDQSLVTYKVTYKRDAQGGSTTVLELKDPEAFKPEPKKTKSAGGAVKPAPIEREISLQERMDQSAQARQNSLKGD